MGVRREETATGESGFERGAEGAGCVANDVAVDGDGRGCAMRGRGGGSGGFEGAVRRSGRVGSCPGAVGVCGSGTIDGVVDNGAVVDDEGKGGREGAGGGSGVAWARGGV